MKINRFVLPIALFAVLVVLLALGVQRLPQKGVLQSPLVGKPAPEFSLPNLMDPSRTVSPSDLKGKWFLVNVWGSWCPTCVYEHETLMDIHRSGIIPILGLNWKDENHLAMQWLQQRGNPYELIAVDKEGRAIVDWGVYGAPETFLVNPDGIIVHKHVGALTPQVWQRDFLSRLPASNSPSS